jgi:hypothetical protein
MSETVQGVATGQPRLRCALKQIHEELLALSESDLLVVNLEPLAAISIVRGALPKVLPLREQIVSTLPKFDLIHLDSLETYALALHQTHSDYCAARDRQEERTALAAEAYQLRERLLSDVKVLKNRGVMKNVNLSELKGSNGHLNIACDVMLLATLLRNRWEQVSTRCAVNLEELDRAEVLSDKLTLAVGKCDRVPELLKLAGEQRQRAYTLFVRAYTEVRAAVVYLRRNHGDADKVAPSLYGKRKRISKSLATETVEAKPVPQSITPSECDATTIAATSSADTNGASVGIPGANPFLN